MKTRKPYGLLLLAVLVLISASSAQSVPTGFVRETVTTGFTFPIALDQLPDGRFLIVEQRTHLVKLIVNGVSTTIGMIPNVSNAGLSIERGIQHATLDPAWPTRPYLYVWYTHAGTQTCRLSMFTMIGDLTNSTSMNLSVGSGYAILTDIPDVWDIHNGGTIQFGTDGMLYLSTGEDFSNECNAQDITTGLGCIMRLDVSSFPQAGSGPPLKSQITPAGNPYPAAANFGPLVWHHGLRNPFRFHMHPITNEMMIGDVGDMMWEELSYAATPGLNFGWPYFEGNHTHAANCPNPPTNPTPALLELGHSQSWFSITSFGFYFNQPAGGMNLGPAYEGSYFFGDYVTGVVRRMVFNGTNWVAAPPVPGQPTSSNWATGLAYITDFMVGNDGAIYYLNHIVGTLNRIRPAATPTSMVLVSGDNQAVNAGFPSTIPLSVRVDNFLGTPVAGASVYFTLAAGGGGLPNQPVVTGPDGIASVNFTPSETIATDPILTATVAGLPPINFNLIWRGLQATYTPSTASVALTVLHSEKNSPLLFIIESGPAFPVFTSPYGVVQTNAFTAPLGSGYLALDGLGFYGPPDPIMVTRPDLPRWDLLIPNLPPFGNLTIHLQVYAFDTLRLPATDAYFISNTVTLTLL